MSANWISVWSGSQRGMGLVSHLFQKKQLLHFKVPATSTLRFRFSTWYEQEEITLQDVCLQTEKGCYPIQFSKKRMYTIAPQASILSDELCIPEEIMEATLTYTIESNQPIASAIQLMSTNTISASNNLIYACNGIDIKTDKIKSNVAVIGDSITEQGMWTQPVANWLREYGIHFLNHGISGNRLCKELSQIWIDPAHTYMFEGTTMEKNDEVLGWHKGISLANQCFGKAGCDRFQKEILLDKGCRLMMFALGTNDLYQPGTFCALEQELVTLEEFMTKYRCLFKQAKQANMKTIALCIPPFKGADAWTSKKEELRIQINNQLYKEPLLDGVVSFDEVLCDETGALNDAYYNEDHLHPNAIGGSVMADRIQKELSVWLGYLQS